MSNHSKPRVVVTQRIHPEIAATLSEQAEPVIHDQEGTWLRAELLSLSQTAEALIVFMPDALDADFLEQCPRLKIVSAALKGFDNFDVDACTRLGIWFTIVPDLLSEATAELALALALALSRNVLQGDALLRSGRFEGWRPVLYGKGLHRATVGIVGFGAVGRELARLLQPFQCRLLVHDVNAPSLDNSARSVSLAELLRESDFVFPLLPLTPSTLGMFGSETIAFMRNSAFLVNVARGSVVNEAAVADALESGKLAGYAADTFEMEDWARPERPRAVDPRLLQNTVQTVFTPHLGSAVRSVRLAIERAAANSALQALRGERPDGAINNPGFRIR